MTEGIMNIREITIYEHVNYEGRSQKLGPGRYNIGDLSLGNDCLSSLKIPEGVRVTLYEHADFTGNEKQLNMDTPWVGNDFNDRTSSILVEMVRTEGTFSEDVTQPLKVEESTPSFSDCVKFSVDVEIFEISGTIRKTGRLTLRLTCLDAAFHEFAVDISEKEFCKTFNYGIGENKFCFYLKDSCLWMKYSTEGWFQKKVEINEKIVSFKDKTNEFTSLKVDIYTKLKELNCAAEEVAKFMKDLIPGVTSDVLAASLKGAGYGLNEIGNALQKVGCVPNEIASALRKAGYNASEVAKFMKEFIPNMTGEVMAVALKGAGYGITEVGNALKEVGYGVETIASALRRAGYNATEAANFIKHNIPGVTGEVLAAALRGAGYGLNEIGTALQVVGYGVETIASALRKAGYNANEAAKFMKEFIPGITGEVMDKVLKNAGYGLNEIENALVNLGGKFAEFFSKIPIPPIKPPWKLF